MNFAHPLAPLVLDLGSVDPQVRLQAVLGITRQLRDPGFLETLRRLHLTPLVYSTLTRFSRPEVGEVPLLDELRWDYFTEMARNRIQESETRLLVQVLAGAGAEVILLKGGDIRHRLYDDPVCRPMGDLDVLISFDDLERARIPLEQQGYTLSARDLDLRPGFNRRYGWVACYQPPPAGLALDAHWEIQEAGTIYRLPYGPLRARAQALELEGLPALALAPEHLLMHLCLHTFGEIEYAPLMKISDLGWALQRFSLDWDLFLADAAGFRIQAPLLWIFQEIVCWRPGLVPEAVLGKLAAYRPGWAERFILQRQANAVLVASLLALWRHLPVKDWPAYLWAKIWPAPFYLEANKRSFRSRADYLRHVLGRAKQRN